MSASPKKAVKPSLHVAAESAKAPVVNRGDRKFRFGLGISGFTHLWSTDGVECLWCSARRQPAAIKAWFEAGKPEEACNL